MRKNDHTLQGTASRIPLHAHGWQGTLLDNRANAARQGSGFNPLRNAVFPQTSLFRDDAVGWNFEHIFNGTAADAERSMFTPREDACLLRRVTDASVSICWPAAGSSWGAEAAMQYTAVDPHTVDLSFEIVFNEEAWPLGYVAMMWASYMHRTRERRIHFYGAEGDREGWVSFGDDLEDGGFETGTVRCRGVEPLAYEEGAETLNVIEHRRKTFILPFYYGLVAGDGDPTTEEGTMAYVVMFDRARPIRLAMWNFIKDARGKADPHSPAWDWQYVVPQPQTGKTYGYRARILYKPFEGRDAVLRDYESWRRRIG